MDHKNLSNHINPKSHANR
uniref:Uncharacterized protein n=1 Tax=Rhizophora mucronata TaxID=61149 RepID=A0A2P2NW14_RHIMU